MAKIVFTWELGGGIGHIVPYLALVDALQAKGHEVIFIVRDLRQAHLISKKSKATCFQAPIKVWSGINPVKTLYTYAHILHNIGFDDLGSLMGLVQGWQALFNAIHPDLVIFEHSPTALLAARGYTFKKMLMGTGFVIPPPVYPLPNLRFWLKPDPEALRNDEDRTLEIMNRLLDTLHRAPLNCITDLFSTEPYALGTFKELDPYGERDNDRYYGTWISSIGEEPLWPTGQGRKAFVYLKPFPALPALLSMLHNLRMPSIVYVERIGRKLKEQLHSSTLRFVDAPQDMGKVAAQCDVAVLNANLNTSAQMLLAGKPALHLPLYLEQYLTAHTIEKIGAGVSASIRKPDEMAAKLKSLLRSDSYAEAAREFSTRYKPMSPHTQNERLVDLVENILIGA